MFEGKTKVQDRDRIIGIERTRSKKSAQKMALKINQSVFTHRNYAMLV